MSGVLASDAAVPYRPPANPPAHGHHEASSAMVGPLAPVLVDPAAKLRELQDERVVKETLIGQTGPSVGNATRESSRVVTRSAYCPETVLWLAWVS